MSAHTRLLGALHLLSPDSGATEGERASAHAAALRILRRSPPGQAETDPSAAGEATQAYIAFLEAQVAHWKSVAEDHMAGEQRMRARVRRDAEIINDLRIKNDLFRSALPVELREASNG
ncbi:MAG: hypothetical protein AAFR76_01610 [Planctomycetota bacterium]